MSFMTALTVQYANGVVLLDRLVEGPIASVGDTLVLRSMSELNSALDLRASYLVLRREVEVGFFEKFTTARVEHITLVVEPA